MEKPLHIGIIGGGPAGYVAALYAAAKGAHVTLVEKSGMGGTCLQKGCIPTKRLVSISHLIDKIKDAEKFGIDIEGQSIPRWEKMQAGVDQLVNKIENDLKGLLNNRQVVLIESFAKPCVKEGVVSLELEQGEQLEVDRLLLCTGSNPHRPITFPFDDKEVCTSDDIWQWPDLPKSLTIVGEGVIACEFAFIFRAMNVDVSVLGMMKKPLPNMDKNISATIHREMKKKKIRFKGGKLVSSLERTSDGWNAYSESQLLASAERVLVCTGRVPNTSGLGLEENHIQCDKRGAIGVDGYMRTNVPHVYAAGDVTGGIMLAHAASEQARIAIDHMLGEETHAYDVSRIPSAVFTTPEVASIGLTEAEALQQELQISTGVFDMRGLGKAHAMGEITGSIKLIVEKGTRRLIGAHMVGANVTEMIHETAVVIARQGSVDDIIHTVHAHPTLSEAIFEAAEDVFGQACHKPQFIRN